MKYLILVLSIILFSSTSWAQNMSDEAGVIAACNNYIDGFYKGDTAKLQATLSTELYKAGYWKDKTSGAYGSVDRMTYEAAIDYSRGVLESKKFADEKAPRSVEVLDVSNHIAAAKITAWWGYDYVLLSQSENGWTIHQVLWEGPLPK